MTQSTIDLRDCVRVIKKRNRLILNTCLGAVIIALLISFITPPTYEAVTSLRIKAPRGLSDSLLSVEQPGGSALYTKQTMATYSEMLKSRAVVQAAIDKIYADKDNPPPYENIVNRITIQPSKEKEADILYLRVQADSPDEAQLLANTFSENLVSSLTAEQGVVREFIGKRLKESKQDLEKAEGALEQYKRDQKMIAPDVQSKAMVDKLTAVDRLAAENTVNVITAQARLSSAQRQLAGEKPGFIADNALIQQQKARLADLEVELARTLPQYTDSHPKVITLRAAIDETRSKLNTEVARVANAESPSINPVHVSLMQAKTLAEADQAAAAAQKRAIENILANSEKELAALPAKEQGITRLTREAQVAQDMYTMLDRRYEEARINEVMKPSDVKVIDAAVAPTEPVKPRKILNALLGAVLGLVIGTAGAFLMEYTNRPILNEQEARQWLALPVLGIIPDFDRVENLKRESVWNKIRNLRFRRKT